MQSALHISIDLNRKRLKYSWVPVIVLEMKMLILYQIHTELGNKTLLKDLPSIFSLVGVGLCRAAYFQISHERLNMYVPSCLFFADTDAFPVHLTGELVLTYHYNRTVYDVLKKWIRGRLNTKYSVSLNLFGSNLVPKVDFVCFRFDFTR